VCCIENARRQLRLLGIRRVTLDSRRCTRYRVPLVGRHADRDRHGEASYHATYDYCTSDFLDQAGVTNEFVYLPTVGIRGNGHMLMLERNNLEIAEFLRDWLEGEVRK
jgi:hypothetical protein